MKVIVLTDYYLPGHKAGGVITGVSSLIEVLGDELDFRVITSDRDLGENQAYPGCHENLWHSIGKARVQYLKPGESATDSICQLLSEENFGGLYINSVFSRRFSIYPLWSITKGVVPQIPIILAPRGELFPQAIKSQSTLRKNVYLKLLALSPFTQSIRWHAANEEEKKIIQHHFGSQTDVIVGPDLINPTDFDFNRSLSSKKIKGSLKMVFLGRLSPIKNLDFALKCLQNTQQKIELTLFGPLEDKAYWQSCQQLITTLPSTVQVHYDGELERHEVHSALKDKDLLFLPSQSESFGYSIVEALCLGVPVLTSQNTPWKDLEKQGAGWALPLSKPDQFSQIIEDLASWETEPFLNLKKRAQAYGSQIVHDPYRYQQNRQVFHLKE